MSTFRNILAAVAIFYLSFATPCFASDFDNQIFSGVIFGDSSPVIMDGTSDNVLYGQSFDIGVSNGRGRCHVHTIVDDEGHYMEVCQ